jgi:hypothetical protein
MSHDAAAAADASPRANRAAMLWGIAVGVAQAATPLLIWWLDRATVYALGLVVIAAIYVGFAVADGRPKVIAVESGVTFAFVVVAAAAGERITVAARGRPGGAWAQGPLAAPNPLRRQHALVAAVLHGRRLGRRRDHRRRDRRRHAFRIAHRSVVARTR